VREIIDFLQLLDELTKLVSESLYPTISCTFCLLPKLIEHIKKSRDDPFFGRAAANMLENLSKYHEIGQDDLARAAACLDPRIKLSYFDTFKGKS